MEEPTIREKIASLQTEAELAGFLFGLAHQGLDTHENKNLLEMRRHELREGATK